MEPDLRASWRRKRVSALPAQQALRSGSSGNQSKCSCGKVRARVRALHRKRYRYSPGISGPAIASRYFSPGHFTNLLLQTLARADCDDVLPCHIRFPGPRHRTLQRSGPRFMGRPIPRLRTVCQGPANTRMRFRRKPRHLTHGSARVPSCSHDLRSCHATRSSSPTPTWKSRGRALCTRMQPSRE